MHGGEGIISRAIERSHSFEAARDRFLDDVEAWMDVCIRELAAEPPTSGHDQCTYATAWLPLLQARPSDRAGAFLLDQRDRVRDHFVTAGLWHHGYWRRQEVHHGTEHFELFLGFLRKLYPDDPDTSEQLLDAAEHLGNRVEGVPPWFDWDTGLFRSMYLGTEEVRTEGRSGLNVAEHFRCVRIALLAHEISQERWYLELAEAHAGLWAEAILAGESIPRGILPTGPVTSLAPEVEAAYRGFAGMASALDDPVECVENLLASGAVEVLLDLWVATRKTAYRAAAERLLDVLATQLGDPDAGPAADALRTYRRITADTRCDAAVLGAADVLHPGAVESVSLEPYVRHEYRPRGIGKRKDMGTWYEDGRPRRHNPILLSLAAEVRQDERLATQALDLARAHFLLARDAYPHGRDHGCAATTVSAVARGHGRDNNAGMVTAVLGPLMDTFGRP